MFRDKLLKRLEGSSIILPDRSVRKLVQFHEMLVKENSKMNLTRITQEDEAIDLNYIDSLSPFMFSEIELNGVRAADIGSGAGFPGLILALVAETSEFSFFDAQKKRVDFLAKAINELGINARVYHMRAEDAARIDDLRESFDIVTSRAVANLATLAEYTLPLLRIGGEAILWKGPGLERELEDAETATELLGGHFEKVYDVPLEKREWQHKLLIIRKKSITPEKYPRRVGLPLKRPLGCS